MDSKETVGLYLFLKGHESELDLCLAGLLQRIENELFMILSIGEIEELAELYAKNIDVIKEKR